MRLHTLTMTAIGPYAGTETIDFDALAVDGLFLFTGPTGAGKSTVLDAVTYALYGKLPGTREGHLSRLKSDFADPHTRPEVVLELTISGERLRIHRSPSYERPKKRGQGVTLERSSVAVERRAGSDWIGVEGARTDQVANDWLQERIGLNCDQFTQVVLLPQGQFAEFLHAGDDVREKLLTSLFNAHRFKEVEDWFDDRQRAEAALAAEAEQKVASLRTKAQAIADVPDDDLPDTVDAGWFEALAEDHRRRSALLYEQLKQASELHEQAAARLRAAEETCALQKQRAQARELHDKVEAQREGIALLRRKHERASAAAVVVPLAQARDARAEECGSALETLNRARAELAAHEPGLEQKSLAQVRRRCRTLSVQRGSLDEALAAERRVDTARAELGRASAELREIDLALAGLRETAATMPERRARAEAELSDRRSRAAVLDDATAVRSQLRHALEAAKSARQVDAQLLEARRYAVDCGDEVIGAREATLDLRERRIAGMAAELARDLSDGQACAACGSSTHPQLAQPAGNAPTDDEIEAAEERLERARSVKDAATQVVSEFEVRLAGLQATAGNRSVTDLERELTHASARVTDAAEAHDDLPRARAALQQVEDDAQSPAATSEDTARRRDEAAGRVRELTGEVDRYTDLIDKGRAGFETVAQRTTAVDRAIEAVEAYADAIEAHDAATVAFDKAASATEEAALDAGFASVAEALESVWHKKTLTEAGEMIRQFDRDESSAAGRLADPRLAGLPDEVPDVGALSEARTRARSVENEARDLAAGEEKRAARLAKLAAQSHQELADALALSARAAEVKSLALLIRGMGANTKKMNLTSYFLAARLEQVTDVASGHLARMSSGRYRLQHTDERRTARGHGGLGLEVFDAYTGKSRPPHSLSGGETFYASVALALGLAEVVTAETGAMTLDSLFIDEGFGSLDGDTLELAMRVLDDLRQVGRTIGVISHVDEMKTRIHSQLVIERTDRGSRVLPHGTTAG